jgi:hypothetical protein
MNATPACVDFALVFALGLVAATVGAAQPTMAGTVEEEHATVIVAPTTDHRSSRTSLAHRGHLRRCRSIISASSPSTAWSA